MALRPNTNTNINTDSPFEDFDDVAVAEMPSTAVKADMHDAAVRAIAVSAPKDNSFSEMVEGLRTKIDFDPKVLFKPKAGAFRGPDSANLGEWIEVTLINWGDHWEISPGSAGDAAKKLLAYSEDGVTITGIPNAEMRQFVGMSVTEYVKMLKTELGMPGAGARRFVDLCVFLHASDKVSDDFENMPLNLSLPPTSAVGFDGHQKSLQRIANAQKMGLPVKVPENPLRFYMWCVGKKSGTNEWTAAEVGNNLPSTMRRSR